ncbi:hypothetical protein GCM10027590_33730 [Nocardiopsis nanhaiensis]
MRVRAATVGAERVLLVHQTADGRHDVLLGAVAHTAMAGADGTISTCGLGNSYYGRVGDESLAYGVAVRAE